MKWGWILSLGVMLLSSASALAQTPTCDALSGDAKEVAESVMGSSYLYDCCDDTISKCLQAATPCDLAKRLANQVCRLAEDGKKADEIKRVLEQRALSMSASTKPVPIELRPEMVWGNPQAKVVLTVYLCGRCPYCAKHIVKLMDAMESTGL
ncbi:MAG: hypothetical protein RBU37_22305, partial [Myxococcota bacterium]|nr:hypothetical protein [Myxococcota bacterium]